ncbi:hypothetical protein [Acinetobacter sp. ANC 4635]|uniref:hypothetical protein n=1 Tax=Acinetobacter sp. ANC 4635 TaxID=2529846 RepID=UPI001040008B|nr:hypothetical protein [Acinetobacter sp. ANC 4635]TCB32814.1 hypothetical protein E0H86_05045 [Acinetobacter sp. ANC 4635]
MKKLLLVLSCTLCSLPVLAKTEQVTVTVKKIEGYGESGDAYTFKATSGKRYMVYNAGGAQPISGEALIMKAEKNKQPICLKLVADPSQPRMVDAVRAGRCK